MSRPPDDVDFATACARAFRSGASLGRTVPAVPPIALSSVYRIEGLEHIEALYRGDEPGYFYARDGHPNAADLAGRLAELEGAEAGAVCASGMAATVAAILPWVSAGDSVALARGVYGKTATFLVQEMSRFGITTVEFDAARPETLRAAFESRPGIRLVYAETLSNPLMGVADIPGLAETAHTADALLVIDNTFAPLLCRPLALGADLVLHSITKLIGGHSDLTQGALAGPRTRIDRAAKFASTFGFTGNPFESWLALRGLATLPLRVERVSATALDLARRLSEHPRVAAVHYPGLESHPDHALARRLLRGGFGSIVSIDLGAAEAVDRLMKSLRGIPFAPSLGGLSTTLSYPVATSHRGLSPEARGIQGITEGLVRLSIGLEDADMLWSELKTALG